MTVLPAESIPLAGDGETEIPPPAVGTSDDHLVPDMNSGVDGDVSPPFEPPSDIQKPLSSPDLLQSSVSAPEMEAPPAGVPGGSTEQGGVASDVDTPPDTPPSFRQSLPTRLRSASQSELRPRPTPTPQRISSISITPQSSLLNPVLAFRSPASHPFLSTADVSLNTSSDFPSGQSVDSIESAQSASSVFTSPQTHKPLTAYESGEVLSWNTIQHTDDSALSPEKPSPLVKLRSKDDGREQSAAADAVEATSPLAEQSATGGGSLWDLFMGELTSTDFDESYETKKERVQNFLNVPYELEKFMLFGLLICFDSFLYIFTILPVRIIIALSRLFRSFFSKSVYLKSAEKCDLIKGALIAICCYMLQSFDASRLYHSVRGQAVIKLYVVFNTLEICDKLCSAFGHDILDSLFSKATVRSGHRTPAHRKHLGRATHFVVALLYVFTHSIVLFYQVMTLNVSVNSYNNALLTLLLSNQFVEIKGSVFKKFEKENLFQLSCADIVERFQLAVFLFIITLRNYIELTGGASFHHAWTYIQSLTLPSVLNLPSTILTSLFAFDISSPHTWSSATNTASHLPLYITQLVTNIISSVEFKMIEVLATPIVVVYGTEVLVDWLKHAFITKFNQIKPGVYGRFRDSLCRDLVGGRVGKEKGGVGEVGSPGGRETLHMLGIVGRGGYDDEGPAAAAAGAASADAAWRRVPIPEPPMWVVETPWAGGRWVWEWLWRGMSWMQDADVRGRWSERGGVVASWVGVVAAVFSCLLLIKLILGRSLLQMSRTRVHQLHIEQLLYQQQHQPSSHPQPAPPPPRPPEGFATPPRRMSHSQHNPLIFMKRGPSQEWASDMELSKFRPPVGGVNGGLGPFFEKEGGGGGKGAGRGDVEEDRKSAMKLDSIDRFQMVRSRIV
ncbi:hypothetical protein HDV00_000621 [Rhizophlyctis rosea]|nr:hypothetical protein HDV00_000621 [Rhizophlyctis rosea]